MRSCRYCHVPGLSLNKHVYRWSSYSVSRFVLVLNFRLPTTKYKFTSLQLHPTCKDVYLRSRHVLETQYTLFFHCNQKYYRPCVSSHVQLVSDMLESPTMFMSIIAGGFVFLVIMAFVFVITRRLLFTRATRGWLV